eukprot:1144270-Pelagomonas_calceolata.AAC.7
MAVVPCKCRPVGGDEYNNAADLHDLHHGLLALAGAQHHAPMLPEASIMCTAVIMLDHLAPEHEGPGILRNTQRALERALCMLRTQA